MQIFMQWILSTQIFIFCISGAIFFIGTELGIQEIIDRSSVVNSLNGDESISSLNDTFTTTANDYESNPFNAVLIFGDFGRAISNFMSVISGGYLYNLMAQLGLFPHSFVLMLQIIYGLGIIFTLIYLVSGRG